MKRIACFCIPAHGHTNPMLAVTAALVRRGNTVRFYSFSEFADKIRSTGAEYVECDRFLPALSDAERAGLMQVSASAMTMQSIRITEQITAFLDAEYASFQPEIVFTDSVCFWGKLSAEKHHVPAVISTSTFAFNSLSSQYRKDSPRETLDVLTHMPKMSKALRGLRKYGYPAKSLLSMVMSADGDDSVVYTSRRFQPYGESFSAHYAFTGPSLPERLPPDKEKARPLLYISMGTVLNDCPDFYRRCIEAFGGAELDVIMSCGDHMQQHLPDRLPENIRAYPRVDQLAVLARADAFLTHCGMNSVSESLFSAAPMILFPQTGEQAAVARRTAEVGAGLLLRDASPQGLREAVQTVLHDPRYAQAAAECSADLRACPGPEGAAAFIEGAPHTVQEPTIMQQITKKLRLWQILWWAAAVLLMIAVRALFGTKYLLLIGTAAGVLFTPFCNTVQKRLLRRLTGSAQQSSV